MLYLFPVSLVQLDLGMLEDPFYLFIYINFVIYFHTKIREHAWQIDYLDSSCILLLYNFWETHLLIVMLQSVNGTAFSLQASSHFLVVLLSF